jgi:bla regulator protein blaR1
MDIFNQKVVQAISWTLIHSLWQGLIVALMAGLIILATKKANVRVRYNLLTLLLLFFLSIVAFTFFNQFQNELIINVSSRTSTISNVLPLLASKSNPAESIDLITIGINFLNKNAIMITFLWLFILGIKCFKIVTNFGFVYRVRHYKTHEVSIFWRDKISELCHVLEIKKKIILLESQLINVPSVTGYFKPIILLPLGLLSSLPQDQIEAILLHELAHIRRKDYLMNLLQNLVEMMFFFNPGLLWLLSLINDERENCCDDVAINVLGNKEDFVHALVSFQEFNHQHNNLVMGFSNRKNSLLQRADRIIYDNNKTLNAIEKRFLLLCFVGITSFVLMTANAQKNATSNSKLNWHLLFTQFDRSKQKKIVDGKTESESDQMHKEYQDIDSILELKKKIAKLELDLKIANERLCDKPTKTTTKTTKSTNYEKIITDDITGKIIKTGVTAPQLPDNFESEQLTDGIIDDLIKDKIIKNRTNLSFKLSNSDFILNGIKQSKKLHQALKLKHSKGKEMSILYNYEIRI